MSPGACNVNKFIYAGIIACSVSLLDFLTKSLIEAKVRLYESISVLSFLNIVHVRNKGAAFSLFTSLGNGFFVGISLLAIFAILVYIAKLPKGMELTALSLILGGAAGNLIDRIRIGEVVDFIDVFVGSWHWPAFNVADSALTVGIALFILANIRQGKPPPPESL
jgi:signal peptidase II